MVQVVLEKVMLRRQKDQILNGQPLIILPARTVEIVECEFDTSETAFYRNLENKMEDTVHKLMHQEKAANYTSVLLLLLRLRQGTFSRDILRFSQLSINLISFDLACNHPCLVSKDYKTDREAIEPRTKKTSDDDDDELAAMFGQLGVTPSRKCQVCQVV
jgi:SNF2 family DNA or RNA helicase